MGFNGHMAREKALGKSLTPFTSKTGQKRELNKGTLLGELNKGAKILTPFSSV
jgi:hypothetical protein